MAIQNAQLYAQGQELAAVQERNRLARDLHDAVTQTLFSASLIAEALPALWERDALKGRESLGKLRQMSRGALAEMRALLLELRPTSLLETRLGDLLRQLGEVVTSREGIPVLLQIDDLCVIPNDLRIALYRIAQEALNNVVKHARADRAEIHLRTICNDQDSVEKISLEILDNGRGFNPDEIPSGRMGLNIMKERARSVSASLQIHSRPGSGTRINVEWVANIDHLEQLAGEKYEQ